jgi:phosphonate transport system substrate-binding protein
MKWSNLALSLCALAATALLFVVPTHRTDAAEPPKVAPSGGQAAWPSKIVLGLVPSESGADIIARYQPMVEQLRQVLGIEIEPMTATDYSGVVTAMAHKHVDVAYLGPKAYVEAADRAGAQAIAMELGRDGQAGYKGMIVCKKGAATTLNELRGKTLAFTDPNSTSGYLVPLMHFRRDLHEEPKGFFREVRFAGSHAGAVLAVINGSVDAAATNDLDLGRLVQAGQVRTTDLEIVWTSELIPGAPMVVRKDLPESLKAAIIGALVTLRDHKDQLEKLGNGGYIAASDSDYDVMRYLLRLQEEEKKQP